MPRTFALIPAAGHSQRMGQPKLLLPLAGRPLILHTIEAWRRSKVDRVVIVVRPGDEALAATVRATGVELVIPAVPPPDMKASLQAALRHIEQHDAPTDADAFLVAPADIPRLSAAVIDLLIGHHHADPQSILVPTLHGRRGHPSLFPWPLAAEVHSLAAEEGLSAIVHRHEPRLVPCDGVALENEDPFQDVDTPDEFQRAAGEYDPGRQRTNDESQMSNKVRSTKPE